MENASPYSIRFRGSSDIGSAVSVLSVSLSGGRHPNHNILDWLYIRDRSRNNREMAKGRAAKSE